MNAGIQKPWTTSFELIVNAGHQKQYHSKYKKSRKLFLDEFLTKITHKPNKPSISQPEKNNELQSAVNLISYINWLSNEGLKQYDVPIEKKLELGR